jgi:hypothetical protein
MPFVMAGFLATLAYNGTVHYSFLKKFLHLHIGIAESGIMGVFGTFS